MDARGSGWCPIPWEGLVRCHPNPTSPRPRRLVTRLNPQVNHVQSTDLLPPSHNRTANKLSFEDFDGMVSSLAESVHTKTASSSDSDSLETKKRGNYQGPHSKNSHSVHRGVSIHPHFHASPSGFMQPNVLLTRTQGTLMHVDGACHAHIQSEFYPVPKLLMYHSQEL